MESRSTMRKSKRKREREKVRDGTVPVQQKMDKGGGESFHDLRGEPLKQFRGKRGDSERLTHAMLSLWRVKNCYDKRKKLPNSSFCQGGELS